MESLVFINDSQIGIVDLKIIDADMGVIAGDFVEAEGYGEYKKKVQLLTENNGNANSNDFNFRIVVQGVELNPVGGICLIDSEEFSELYLEAAGISLDGLKL